MQLDHGIDSIVDMNEIPALLSGAVNFRLATGKYPGGRDRDYPRELPRQFCLGP